MVSEGKVSVTDTDTDSIANVCNRYKKFSDITTNTWYYTGDSQYYYNTAYSNIDLVLW